MVSNYDELHVLFIAIFFYLAIAHLLVQGADTFWLYN